MIFKVNLNVTVVVFKSNPGPLEILIGVCQHRLGREMCPHLLSTLLQLGWMNLMQLLTLFLLPTVLISSN